MNKFAPVPSFYDAVPAALIPAARLDAAKGLLITLIVAGHLRHYMRNYDPFIYIYNFHVAGFLLLPFLYPIARLSWERLKIWGVRYYTPFFLFFALYALLNYAFVYNPDKYGPFAQSLGLGLLTQTAEGLDRATGTEILWFLPALFVTVLSLSLFVGRLRLSWPWLLAGAFLLQGTIGLLPREIAIWVPFSANLVAYLFFWGLVIRWFSLQLSPEKGARWQWVFLLLFALSQYLMVSGRQWIGLAGMELSSFADPWRHMLAGVMLVSVMLYFFTNRVLEKIAPLRWLGRHSLIIFLVHQPLLFVFFKLFSRVFGDAPRESTAVIYYGAGAFLLALGVSALAACIVERSAVLRLLVTPQRPADWRELGARFIR